MDIGLIGLGTMGRNLVLNMEEHGYSVAVYNRTTKKMLEFIRENPDKQMKGYETIEQFIQSLKEPRIIFVLVEAGCPVDQVLEELRPYLSINDTVVDAGNSNYLDTERISEKYKNMFSFVGCGVSGGEEGARHGPSIMPGGDSNSWPALKSILYKIAAKTASNEPCCEWIGPGGAGHFVKMVHNGIEYGEMAILSEIFLILRKFMNLKEISDIFEEWNKNEETKSYLIEIASRILRKKENGDPVIEKIEDRAAQKGTGKWCLEAALECNVPVNLMVEAVFSRMLSAEKEKREFISREINPISIPYHSELIIDELKHAYILSRAVSYIQGFNLMKSMSRKKIWNLNLNDIARIWKNGCIIRSEFLNVIQKIISEDVDEYEFTSTYRSILQSNLSALRKVVLYSVERGIPVPVLGSCICYLDGLLTANGPGGFIQCLRDYFGAHKVRFMGENEDRHYNWDS